MKAFIAVTLLAACVAAQTIDQQTGGLFNHPMFWKNTKENTLGNLLNNNYNNWGQQYQASQNYGVKGFPYTLPTSYNTVGTTQYTLEEIIRHPLFQQYWTLPLFRQHFSHPLFQLYLTTPNFQQYWIYQEFQTYFRNPYLFYKYVYPVVFNTPTQGVYGQQQEQQSMWNKNVYPVLGHQQNVPRPFFGDKTYQQYDNVMGLNKQYNQYNSVAYPFNTGYPVNTNQIHYNYLMDKIFKTLFLNKPEVTEVKTDVKIRKPTNQVDEQTLGKYVDPITGEVKYTVGDIKTVEDKVYRVPVEEMTKPIESLIDGDYVKDAMLKKYILNKALYGNNRKIVDQVYPTRERVVVPENWMNMNKYETLPMDNKYERIDEQLNKFVTNDVPTLLPTHSRTKRHAVYTPLTYVPLTHTQTYSTNNQQQSTYNYNTNNKNAKSLNYVTYPYYTVPLTYGAQTHYTYGTPLTYTYPATTYVQPSVYYPGQALYV